jgi:septal ring factor EnvC (AmiA/AmiB activator)
MKKKRKLNPTEYQVYKKQHDYDDVIAAEEAKISNEKETYTHLQKKSKQKLQKQIQSLKTAIDPDSVEDDLDITEEELVANRTIRNARTHKNRLHGLKSYEDD